MLYILIFIFALFSFVKISCMKIDFQYRDIHNFQQDYNLLNIQTSLDSINIANMSVKVNLSIEDGPGQNLITDPNHNSLLFGGNTINIETFETQFVLDIAYVLNISPNRIHIVNILKGSNHFSWESTSVIVYFFILETSDSNSLSLINCIQQLTIDIQNNNSLIYHGTNITKYIDDTYGLNVQTMDISLKLSYAIEIVGGNAIRENYYLNQGSLGLCDTNESIKYSYYCEFESMFENDISIALNISSYRIQVLFVKVASLDSVIITFRILPAFYYHKEDNISIAISNLIHQVKSYKSKLYEGNVTIRVDPTWGVSNMNGIPRSSQPLYTQLFYELQRNNKSFIFSLQDNYSRCKANHRCNWGSIGKL